MDFLVTVREYLHFWFKINTSKGGEFVPSVFRLAESALDPYIMPKLVQVPEIVDRYFHGEIEMCLLGTYCSLLSEITRNQEIYISSIQLAKLF